TIRRIAGEHGAAAVVAEVPFPIQGPDDAANAIMGAVTERTRFAVVSHVTSATAIVLPIEQIVGELRDRRVEAIVDGAHAPGMVPIDVERIGATAYTGNAHKWLCTPKGSAFLHVRRDRQADILPPITSHGANSPRRDRS